MLEDDDALLVQEHQGALDGGVNVRGFRPQHQVPLDGLVQFLEVEFQQEVGARGGIRGDLGQERVEDQRGQPPALLGQRADGGPVSPHLDPIRVSRDIAQINAAVGAGKSAPVLAEALEQGPHDVGGGAAALVAESLVQQAQRKGQPAFRVRLLQRQHVHELAVGRQDPVQPQARVVRHFVAHKGGELHVALHEAGLRHAAEHLEDLGAHELRVGRGGGVAFGVAGEFRQQRQLVHGKAFGRRRVEDLAQDGEPEGLLGRGEVQAGHLGAGLVQVFDQWAGLEDTGHVLVALEQVGAFQPGDGGPDLGVGHAVLEVHVDLQFFVPKDLAGCDNDLLFVAASGLAQAPENLGDVAAAELRECLHPELPLAVLVGVEQHTLGLPPVAPGAAGFLQVVLQRARACRRG